VQGWQRAGALVRFFSPLSAQFQQLGIDQPQFLFASGPVSKKDKQAGTGSKSFRPEQTITPLSQFRGEDFPINLNFAEGEETEVAAAVVECGGVAAIAWQHENIPAIAWARMVWSLHNGPETVSMSSGFSTFSQVGSICSAKYRRCSSRVIFPQ